MKVQPDSFDFTLDPADNERLANLCGQFDEHLRQVEGRLGVEVTNRGNHFRVIGDSAPVQLAGKVLKSLYSKTAEINLTPSQVHLVLQQAGADVLDTGDELANEPLAIQTRRGLISGRALNQQRYLQNILKNDINFGIGPAGTGKTYLAVACAVQALEQEKVARLVLTRPAVEAGERLGFLPGDLAQKIDPYLRPLYDALYEMLGFERVAKLVERNVIEIAPLAYMRGRTLNDSFIILDEAQNTTVEQMKMFLTRIGFASKAVITGDVTQVDLPRGRLSGLRHVVEVLKDVDGISFTFFKASDVVRHPLVQSIVTAYESFERNTPTPDQEQEP
ncbi:MAG: PhoH family protein [Gammaproteobacteria bacterium]